LQACYPEHNWILPIHSKEEHVPYVPKFPSTEDRKPVGYWQDTKNQRAFFDELAKKLNIKSVEEWRKVSYDTFIKEGGGFVNRYYKGSILKGIFYSFSI
jgi:hypothetical protein